VPTPVTSAPASAIVEYPVPGVIGIEQIVAGPDGNLWFTGTASGSLVEVVGRITPGGQATLHRLSTQSGGFDGITAGPDGDIWFTESTALRVGRLVPATGRIDEFVVQQPSTPPRNTQVRDIVVGTDGNLWFDVQQVAQETVVPAGYVGRVTPAGAVTLYPVPGGDQPVGIQVGADGSLWSRVAVADASKGQCGALPGYTPTDKVVRVTAAGVVSEMSETSPQFAGDVIGPDGDRWWITSSGAMRRTAPSGRVNVMPAQRTLGLWDAFRFVFGPDGSAWYVDGSSVLRMRTTGQITSYHAIGANSGATWVARGPDSRMWFVEGASGAAAVGAIRPAAD
jgi:virginiamycin B lyase